MDQTCYEVRDARDRNVGECFDGELGNAIERAAFIGEEVEDVGPLRVLRVTRRIVEVTVEEVELVALDGARVLRVDRASADHREVAALRGMEAAPRRKAA